MNEIVEQLKINFDKLSVKVDALTMRERVLIFATVIAVVFFLWQAILYGYFLAPDQQISDQEKKIIDEIALMQGQITVLSQTIASDSSNTLLKKRETLTQDNIELQNKIKQQTIQMVSPKEMIEIVKSVIDKTQGLEIISLVSVPTVPLFSKEKAKDSVQIYKHGLELEMLGHFFDTLRFLEGVEKETHRLLWDNLRYEVKKYPDARIKISIHTLGLDEAWIGV